MKLEKVYKEVALKLGLNESDVKEAYQLYWNFFRKSIESLPLKEDLTEEEFNALKTNINIPSLGKFNCTYNRYLGGKERFKYIKHIKNGNKEN